jgi:anti-anti-sigma factor
VPCDTTAALSLGGRAAYRVAVRAHGLVDEVPGAGPGDHLCWVYEDDAAFDEAAREFLVGGLARGDRLLCVGQRVIDSLQALTPPTLDAAALIAGGAVETLTLAEAYEAAGPFLPEQQLAYYDAATRRAMDDGYRGLRVIAEVSDLAAAPAQRAALVRWEHLADEYAAHGSGFSAMCAYRADLGPEALADVASVHPLVRAPEEVSSFRIFVDGDRIALAGSVDTFSSDRLARVLAAVRVRDDRLVLDLAALEFMDVAGCRVLARWAADLWAHSVALEVTSSSALLRRMWQVLDLARIAPVTFTGALA